MKKQLIQTLALFCLALLFMSGCTASVTKPIVGKSITSDRRFVGTASAKVNALTGEGQGSFSIQTSDGLNCSGAYDPFLITEVPTTVTHSGAILCSDGSVGNYYAVNNIILPSLQNPKFLVCDDAEVV